jgi:hypothetical protein
MHKQKMQLYRGIPNNLGRSISYFETPQYDYRFVVRDRPRGQHV